MRRVGAAAGRLWERVLCGGVRVMLWRKGGEIDDSPVCTVRVKVESDSSDSRQAVVVEGVTLGRSRWSAQEPRTAHHICVWLVKERMWLCIFVSAP